MRQGKQIHSPESFHTKVFTGRYVYSLYEIQVSQGDLYSHKRTCKSRKPREGGMRQGKKLIHPRVFTQKFSRDVMFTPYMNTSLTRRPVFTQEDMQKQETSRRWNETGGKIHSRESFHTKVFTGRYVYSLYEYKSHKETCIHTRGHAKEENLEKVE